MEPQGSPYTDHYPDDPYPLSDINDAAKFVLHGSTLSILLLQPAYGAQPPSSTSQPTSSPSIKTKELNAFFKKFASTLVKALAPQQQQRQNSNSLSQNNSCPYNATASDCCYFCGETGHYGGNCLIATQYVEEGKAQRNQEGRLVLASGAYILWSVPGITLCARFDKYHKRNPNQAATGKTSNSSSQMMYEIYRPPSSSSYQLSNNRDVKQVDQNINDNQQKTREYINSLEREILALRHKQVFDGVEIPRHPQNNRQPLPDNNSTSGPSSSSHPITEPANLQPSENTCTSAMENTAPITIPPTLPPIHPFANVKETNY
jgi:hypothetical protein